MDGWVIACAYAAGSCVTYMGYVAWETRRLVKLNSFSRLSTAAQKEAAQAIAVVAFFVALCWPITVAILAVTGVYRGAITLIVMHVLDRARSRDKATGCNP